MRKIRLSDADAELFEDEMIPSDYEYLVRHKDTFCRMWSEQGNLFWKRYLEVFRSYIVRNHQSLLGLGSLSFDIMRLQHTLDYSFNNIEKSFVDGKVNTAKQLLYQIADLGRNRHKFQFLESKSRSKDPFYTKDTRDLFRDFFGEADKTLSYIRVRLLTPVYMRFGGSVIRCIMRWKEASDMDPSDDSYFTPPLPIEPKPSPAETDPSTKMCSLHLEDCNVKFDQQFVKGNPNCPVLLDFWPGGDPRFEVPGNPLYDQNADSKSDWRKGLDIKKFQEFYTWCHTSDNLVSSEKQCQDCRAHKKSGKKNKKKKKKASAAASNNAMDPNTVLDNLCSRTLVDSRFISAEEDSARSRAILDDFFLDSSLPKSMSPAFAKVHADLRAILDKSDAMAEAVRLEIQKTYAESGMLDNTITTDVSDRFRRKGLESSLKDIDSLTTHCCGKHVHASTIADPPCNGKPSCLCKACECAGDLDDIDVEDNPTVHLPPGDTMVVNGAGAAPLSMAERVKQLEARIPVFPASSVIKDRKEEVLMPVRNGRDIKAIFQIHKKSDDSEPVPAEVQVSLQELCEMDMSEQSRKEPDDSNKSLELGNDSLPPLTSQYLSDTVEGFLHGALCAENEDWCGVEVDYSALEGHHGKATHFILKISKPPTASDLNLAKHVMIQLLWYVVRRKKRPSLGWMMSEEDVFTFCQTLSESLRCMIGMCFTIILCAPTLGNNITPSKVDVQEENQMEQPNAEAATAAAPAAAPAAKETPKLSASEPGATPAGHAQPSATTATAAAIAMTALDKAASNSASASVDDGSEGGDAAAASKSKKKKKKKSKAKAEENGESKTSGDEKAENKPKEEEKADESTVKGNEKQDSKAKVEEKADSKTKGTEKQDVKSTGAEKQDVKSKGAEKQDVKTKGGEKSENKIAKGKDKTVSGAAGGGKRSGSATTSGGVIPLHRGPAERQALSNCKTREELATVLQNLDHAGVTGPVTHTVVSAPSGLATQAERDAAFRVLMQSMSAGGNLTTAGGHAIGDNKSGGYRQKSKCSYCGVVEPAIRTYKKCSRCKQESVANARYYCGRPCQLEDWKYRHNLEHEHGIFF